MDSERHRGSEPQTRQFMIGFEEGVLPCKLAAIIP